MPFDESPTTGAESRDGHFETEISKEVGAEFFPTDALVIDDGPTFFASLEKDIENTKGTIEINTFSWAPDSTGMRIAELISEKAEELERVDIKVDLLGALLVGTKDALKDSWGRVLQKIFASGINLGDLYAIQEDPSILYEWPKDKVAEFERGLSKLANKDLLLELNPALALLANTPNVLIEFKNNPLSRMDHAKIYSFDGKRSYVGGMNIGDDYSGGYDLQNVGWYGSIKPDYWKDYMVRMDSATAGESRVAFLHNESGESDDPKEKQITHALFRLLNIAKQEVIIEHAYLMDPKVIEKLNELANKNVRIMILKGAVESPEISKINDKFFALLDSRIEVIESKEVLHSKFLMVDGRYSLIGSANLTRESLYHHGEVAILSMGEGPLQQQLQLRADLLRAKSRVKRIANNPRKSLTDSIL